jgi:hypothetical protein
MKNPARVEYGLAACKCVEGLSDTPKDGTVDSAAPMSAAAAQERTPVRPPADSCVVEADPPQCWCI